MPEFDNIHDMVAYHGLPFKLRHDQIEDVENLYVYDRVGLFNEVGTGKTATSTVINLAWDPAVIVVLMPPILLPQWHAWLKSLKDIGDVVIYRGSPKHRDSIDLAQYRWWLMTPQIFKNDFQKLFKASHKPHQRLCLTVDEGHCAKNVSSQTYKAIRDFAVGQYLQILTGTPVTSPHDAYGYVKLKTPSVYPSKKIFNNVHVKEEDFYGNVVKWQNLELLQQNLMLQSTRRLSQDVLKDLKSPNYIPIVYDLDPAHFKLYNKLADEQLLELPDGGKIDATSTGRIYNALQQIVCNWAYFAGDESLRPAAFDLIDAIADEIGLEDPANSKLIIFTYYVMTSRATVAYLKERFNAVACYSEVSRAQQERNIAAFLNDPACRVLVAQPGSAGAGWNAQHVCSETLFIEEPVNPKDFHQGVGRTWRDGQVRTPNIRLGIAKGTIQHRLHKRLLDKDALANQVQGGFEDLRDAIHGL